MISGVDLMGTEFSRMVLSSFTERGILVEEVDEEVCEGCKVVILALLITDGDGSEWMVLVCWLGWVVLDIRLSILSSITEVWLIWSDIRSNKLELFSTS